ncbi:hypothetical protein MSG28_012976 [Choristoneura fumiferana]|uniref:Uncharacterized protein n=1 Tax=Choristoneura fumiferana TaxID=7141 RepID=A0ACC0KS60_CHOFU|nr:hypothetical protein MSG28_012976 [Choristoneura fumiferana]
MRLDNKSLFVVCYSTLLVLCGAKIIRYILTEHAVITHLNSSYVCYTNFTSKRHGRRSPMYYVDIHYRSLVPFDNTFKADFYFYEFLSNEYRRGFVEMHFKWCDLIHKDPFFGAAMNQGKFRRPCPFPPNQKLKRGSNTQGRCWNNYEIILSPYHLSPKIFMYIPKSVNESTPVLILLRALVPCAQQRAQQHGHMHTQDDYHMYNMSIPSAAIPPGFPFTKGRIYANVTHRGYDVFGGYIDMELKEKILKT